MGNLYQQKPQQARGEGFRGGCAEGEDVKVSVDFEQSVGVSMAMLVPPNRWFLQWKMTGGPAFEDISMCIAVSYQPLTFQEIDYIYFYF